MLGKLTGGQKAFLFEQLKSRHYLLKFLRRRGLAYPGREPLDATTREPGSSALLAEGAIVGPDALAFGEYMALPFIGCPPRRTRRQGR